MATRFESRDESTSHQPGWMRAAGVAIPLIVVAVLVALKPEILRGTFSSTESVLRVGAVIAGWVLFSWLARRVIPNPLVRSAVIAVPAALLLWLNVAPYFKADVEVAGAFHESPTQNENMAPEAQAAVPTEEDGAGAPPSQPVQLTTGRFRGLDGHRGSGEAAVLRQPDGSHTVAFRNLSVSSVPDPVLYLVPGADQQRPNGATRLGRLDPGRDRYEIPAGVDLDGPLTVLIWCQRFAVPVAGATQTPV
jgi:hypothetical protein